jgi:hypothetical protein
MNTDNILEKSIIVVAHPDDEILWFSSIVDKVDEVLLCFSDCDTSPEWSIGRKKSLSEYPLEDISSLGISQSGVFYGANWNVPVITGYGMEISNKEISDKKYKENYYLLRQGLQDKLTAFSNVITHNPWGDYGHPEHVQVYRVVKELQEKMKFNLWFPNYCSNKSFGLMLRYVSGFNSEYITLKTDKKLGKEIENIYKKNGCWTWYNDWEWFNEESFMKDKDPDETIKIYGHIFPLNNIKIEVPDEKERKSYFFGWRIYNLLRNLFTKKVSRVLKGK